MYVIAGLVMLGVLVIVHEFGHFALAKLFKVGVPVFSVGMGPRIAGFHAGGTDYRLSLLPIGGYVRLAGADPFGEEDPDAVIDPGEHFMNKPIWQRLLVMLAGPGFNLMLPFVVFTGVLMLGEPQPDNSVGAVFPGTPAAAAGLLPGDHVLAVDGHPTEVWEDVERELVTPRDAVRFSIDRDGRKMDVTLDTKGVPVDVVGAPVLERIGVTQAGVRRSARVGVDDPTSPAWVAGLRTGDSITKVDGKDVLTWAELEAALTPSASHEVTYLHPPSADDEGGQIETKTATVAPVAAWTPRPGDEIVDGWGFVPIDVFVGGVTKDSAAVQAGVKVDDRVFAVDGQPVRDWYDMIAYVAATAKAAGENGEIRPLTLSLIRDGQPLELSFTPKMDSDIVYGKKRYRPLMGVGQYPNAYVPGPQIKKYYSLFEAFPRASEKTISLVTQTVSVLGGLFTYEIKPQEALGGPLEIFRMAGEGAKQGIFVYVKLMGMISISLGVINLLPVPVLDGGQILFYAIEGIRGRPLSLALREKVQMVGVLMLVALMLFVLVFDIQRWVNAG